MKLDLFKMTQKKSISNQNSSMNLPSNWKLKRLAALGKFEKGSGIPKSELKEEGLPVILYGDIYTKYNFSTDKAYNRISKQTAEHSNFIENGDLIFAASGETKEEIGKTVVYTGKEKVYIGGDIIKFTPLKSYPKFLGYVLESPASIHQKSITAKGDIVVHTYPSKLREIRIPLPPLPEQKAIAAYLDQACARIDRIIAIKEKQLKKVNEYFQNKLSQYVTIGLDSKSNTKSTRYPWLPSINSNWRATELKRVLAEKLKYGANESAEEEIPENPRYIRITDFGNDGKLKNSTFKSLTPEKAKGFLLNEGDILFARSGATVGKTFLFKDYKGVACFAGYLIKANLLRDKMKPEYLYYFTKSKPYEEWKNMIFTQATIQNIGADKYQYLPITLPPIEEQNQIIERIQLVETKIDNLKNKTLKNINQLKNYRKSLIHECVTGKKQVYKTEQTATKLESTN